MVMMSPNLYSNFEEEKNSHVSDILTRHWCCV